MTWTPEKIKILKEGWNEGLTAAVIADKIGKSRNAVIGKAHRLKLKTRPSPVIVRKKSWEET